ncbi:MAG TPA: neutral/alkaline non-lysosomal ceramidase N-terminal domain-containing protein [Gemmatimonadales bacterium]|nr:neutral/alkaline non-lysosomal ceramidase N-terminal domain-containing protein [Gemmatimonadales bacterium]
MAKRDITPPPGVGLMGNGPEGARSRGYRQRLYLRAVLLEDARGERLALVTADLTHVSAVLHRKAAERLSARCGHAGIGADRLFISATHTHAAPGHFYEAANYNESGSSVPGYDTLIVAVLSSKIADAVCAADSSLQPARLAWGSAPVWGVSRIRSLPAMERNIPPPEPLSPPPPGLSRAEELVNPTLWMLRIDTAAASPGAWAPAGAYASFSMHNTGNAPSGELLDSDIYGRVSQLVERFIDRQAGYSVATSGPPRSTFAIAPGSHGDVSPTWPQDSRCPLPQMRLSLEPTGPLMQAPLDWNWPADRTLAQCDRNARRALESIAQRIAAAADALHTSLAPGSANVTLARAFETLDLEDSFQRGTLCPKPATGLSSFAGAPDSYSRMKGWRLLGLFKIGIEEPSARREPGGCHGHKRQLVSPSFNYKVAGLKLPTAMQLAVARVGDRLLLFTAAEVTTTAGHRLRTAALQSAAGAGVTVSDAIPISLTNGFVQYVATPEEYTAQYYEGGSTIYGPDELPFLAEHISALTASLGAEPTLVLLPIDSRPGKVKAVVDRPPASVVDSARLRPRLTRPLWCGADTLYAAFSAGAPGEWLGDAGPRLELFERDGTTAVAWDDDPRVAVYLMGGKLPRIWQLRFTPGNDRIHELRLTGSGERYRWSCRAS